jgi:hypothetical protein
LFSYLRQHTDKQGGQWIITGSESWTGYWVKTDSESITLKMAHLKGLKSAYVTYYKTDGSYSDGTHDYKFDAHELCVDEDSITDQVTKFYEIQIGRDRYCGIEHKKEQQAADAYTIKSNTHDQPQMRLYAMQIQYFIRQRVVVKHRSAPNAPYCSQAEWHTFAVVLHYVPVRREDGQNVQNPDVSFLMKLESLGARDGYGYENFIPIRQIAGRFIKVPVASYETYANIKQNKQARKHLPLHPTNGFFCSPLPPKL